MVDLLPMWMWTAPNSMWKPPSAIWATCFRLVVAAITLLLLAVVCPHRELLEGCFGAAAIFDFYK